MNNFSSNFLPMNNFNRIVYKHQKNVLLKLIYLINAMFLRSLYQNISTFFVWMSECQWNCTDLIKVQ